MDLCIIPARGGSKRIPRKNIKPFRGRPVISYPIWAARDLVDTVMVSTEDAEIATIAEKYGAAVPFMRSAETATDTAETEEVIAEVLDQYSHLGVTWDRCLLMYPCSVFAKREHLTQALGMLAKHDMMMSVVEYDYPIQRAVTIDPVRLVDPRTHDADSGKLPTMYHDAAQFYAFKVGAFQKAWGEGKRLLEMDGGAMVLPRGRVWDIDTEEDWRIAEVLYGS